MLFHVCQNEFPLLIYGFLSKNVGLVGEEQDGRFHPDIKDVDHMYKGRWGNNMLAD